ncbi:helix-turn-helix transcriptional regulator [Leptolyngbya sp. FACHB-36]|uniref:helix-turn-helix domain-containing protein n=1 Tax=Leptolyngbya sp. FACHB-36 TaxID=2692808 RepID=UPI001680C43A|nr:helix-turn-helix transcriptional regulator [Leptolyngbya sp. FACHB-36]MBD2018672.1 helix-turn-helix transcriptional regulator [Leptolyngbya sp. FACHB-36]
MTSQASSSFNQNISLILRLARVRFRLTQQEVAEKTGIPVTSLTDLESGRVTVGIDRIQVYAEMLGLQTADLIDAAEALADQACVFPLLQRRKKGRTQKTTTKTARVKN